MPTTKMALGVAALAGAAAAAIWAVRRRKAVSPGRKYLASFQQTMLRIKDPTKSVPFYEKHFGMKLVHKYDFPQWKFSLYFMERPHEKDVAKLPLPGTASSEAYLWSMPGTTLELTHNHGSEADPSFSIWSGNSGRDVPESSPLHIKEGPIRGFGHIAFNVPDVYATSAALEAAGVVFQKRPDEGRMKGLAFALDPDGYWIELVKRSDHVAFPEPENLSQTMMRVKCARQSIRFYVDVMGMTMVRAMHVPNDFSNYFFACLTPEERAIAPDPESAEAREYVKTLWQPVLEMTHNHGTEDDADFHVHTGNSEPQGFGHIGFLVDDLAGCCAEMQALGVPFHKRCVAAAGAPARVHGGLLSPPLPERSQSTPARAGRSTATCTRSPSRSTHRGTASSSCRGTAHLPGCAPTFREARICPTCLWLLRSEIRSYLHANIGLPKK